MRHWRGIGFGILLLACVGCQAPPKIRFDHYRFFAVTNPQGGNIPPRILLQSQFDRPKFPQAPPLTPLVMFAPPTRKTKVEPDKPPKLPPYYNEDGHLAWYDFKRPDYMEPEPRLAVQIRNQLTNHKLQMIRIQRAVALLVPTTKLEPEFHDKGKNTLSHYKVYEVLDPKPKSNQLVRVDDQFGDDRHTALELKFFAAPTIKDTGSKPFKILNEDVHLAIYEIDDPRVVNKNGKIDNQFGVQTFLIGGSRLLAVPTRKGGFGPASD